MPVAEGPQPDTALQRALAAAGLPFTAEGAVAWAKDGVSALLSPAGTGGPPPPLPIAWHAQAPRVASA